MPRSACCPRDIGCSPIYPNKFPRRCCHYTQTFEKPFEVHATTRLHLAGKIDQSFFQHEGYGVVFIMNVKTTAEPHELLEALPLGQAGMMEFELIALAPLKPLLRHSFPAAYQSDDDLSTDAESAGGSTSARPHQTRKHRQVSWDRS